jgi:Acetyltransferase (GNAT) domain
MEDTAERKLSFAIRRPRGYLHDMMRTMHDAGPGHLFLAVHDGSPLADVFTFSEKYRFTHGVSRTEKRSYDPNHLLPWEVMRWARERGIKYYDMVGIPEPENRNVNTPTTASPGLRSASAGISRTSWVPGSTGQTRPRESPVQLRAGILPSLLQAQGQRVLLARRRLRRVPSRHASAFGLRFSARLLRRLVG